MSFCSADATVMLLPFSVQSHSHSGVVSQGTHGGLVALALLLTENRLGLPASVLSSLGRSVSNDLSCLIVSGPFYSRFTYGSALGTAAPWFFH